MGTDKAFIELDGLTLLEGAVEALQHADLDPIIVVGGDQPAIERLGLTPVADRYPGEGPLGAVITALDALEVDTVMILPCDLTAASAIAVATVLEALGDADVAVPIVRDRQQWLHSAWRGGSLSTLETAFGEGARSMSAGADGLRVNWVRDGDPCWFHDADTPGDLPPRSSR